MLDANTYMLALSPPVLAAIISVSGGAVIAAAVGYIHLGTRVSLLEDHDGTHKETIGELETAEAAATQRITTMEAVVPELRNLIGALRDVPVILARLDTLVEESARRLEKVESVVSVSIANTEKMLRSR